MSYKTLLHWSSGKDAALTLYYLQQQSNFSVKRLFTTTNKEYGRVTMHGLRTSLLKEQAKSVGIPLELLELPKMPDMQTYESLLLKALKIQHEEGFSHNAFGDIFLEDLRVYRENLIQEIPMKTVFPLWKKDTKMLLNDLIDKGFKAIVVAASATFFDESFLGTEINAKFIEKLPEGVDPCGENGEFHTFCFDGPIFNYPVNFEIGNTTYQEYKNPDSEGSTSKSGFWFLDLLPKKSISSG